MKQPVDGADEDEDAALWKTQPTPRDVVVVILPLVGDNEDEGVAC